MYGIVAGLAGLCSVCDGLREAKSRDHLNKGVQAFKNAKYTHAVEHFKEAIQLDPEHPNARFYLATAYMSQCIPGAESPENQQNAQGCRAGVPEGPRKGSEEHCRASLRWPPCTTTKPGKPAAEKKMRAVGRSHEVVHEAHRSGSEEQGSLLQPRRHHLGEVVSGVDVRPRQTRHEARRSRARSRTRRSAKS